jgi:hypothetical protein
LCSFSQNSTHPSDSSLNLPFSTFPIKPNLAACSCGQILCVFLYNSPQSLQ